MVIKLGTLVDERYRIQSLIGRGGTAEVYEASDIITKKIVAIKIMKDDLSHNPMNLAQFQNEATIAASLTHPNIVRIFNHGTLEGKPYIACEYIKGQTLKEVLDNRSSLSINEAIDIMIQLVSALFFAHQHSIIHRDVKPLNIFYMSDGTVKLGDFGIAQTTEDRKEEKSIQGSLHYLSPEVCLGKPATEQSDIYSCGVTFFELITGKLPYYDVDNATLAAKHVTEKFPSPRKFLPNCPKEVEKIILRACAKQPEDRYSTCLEFKEALEELKKKPNLLEEKKGLLARIFGFK